MDSSLLTPAPAPEVRFVADHRQTVAALVAEGDTLHRRALRVACETAPNGMAAEMAAAAGLTLASDRLAVAPFLEDLPPASPLRGASDDVVLCLASQGHGYVEFLVDEAASYLSEGNPAARVNREWAAERVRAAKAKARAVKAADRAVTPPPSITIARVEAAREALALELDGYRARITELEVENAILRELTASASTPEVSL